MAISRKASLAHSIASTSALDDKVHYFSTTTLQINDNVWVPTVDKKDWELGKVIELNDEEVDAIFVQRTSSPNEKPYFGRKVFPADNPFKQDGHSDMTSMRYINEPQILKNLETRSLIKKPYTLMGPVLISVNPLVDVDDPNIQAGNPKVLREVHPFAVAELSLNQMRFTLSRPEESADVPHDQTIIVSGESGSGKTVNSRKVLDHLVQRSGGGDDLAKAMLGANPILESFGNAKTLRNPNSSRFGRLMKLHFDAKGEKITGASIVTYLLERSRISTHELGERGYHIFYEIMNSGDSALVNACKLDPKKFYHNLIPRTQLKDDSKTRKMNLLDTDVPNFKATRAGLESVGVDAAKQVEIFKVVAAVAHLSMIVFDETDGKDGLVAKVRDGDGTAALGIVSELLGIDGAAIETTLTTRAIGAEKIQKKLNKDETVKNLDGVMKALYSSIFQYIVNCVNLSIKGSLEDNQPSVGVLDIFGFETFAKNDFEQLLINYTNEALQQVFNKQVLEREADLYKAEKLSMSVEDQQALDPSIVHDAKNEKCILLFQGDVKKTAKGTAKKYGILDLIHIEGGELEPSDIKMLHKINAAFAKKEYKSVYQKGKKQDRDKRFKVRHYASTVTYTVGSFLEKNNDRLPKSVNELFASSSSELVKEIWDCGSHLTSNKRNAPSITSKFGKQIKELTGYLDSTQCSFIRCIKPNPRLETGGQWFNRPYVMRQVKNLSISKTADILKSGLPTRIPYDQLVGQYKKIIEAEKLPSFYTRAETESDVKTFIGALFFAFEIERSSYKLGLTKVFFKTGELEKLESVLGAADSWAAGGLAGPELEKKNAVVKSFKSYHMRRRWGVFFAKMQSFNRFLKLLAMIQKRKADQESAALVIQCAFRVYKARKIAKKLLKEKLEKERAEEERKRKEEEARRIKEQEEKARQAAEDLKRLKREMAELKAMEQRRQDRLDAMKLALRANDKKREMEKQEEEMKKEEEQKKEEERKAAEAKIAKEMEELEAISSQRLAYRERRRKLEKERQEEEKKLQEQQVAMEEEEARVFMERSALYRQMVETLKAKMKADEKGLAEKKAEETREEKELAEKVIESLDEYKAERRLEHTDDLDDSDDDEVESVASDQEGGTKESYDKIEKEEQAAEAQQRQEDERIGVEYKGPYNVSMNRYLLEKSEKGRAGKLLNKLRTHWIDCFLFAYPSVKKLLLYHSVKGKKEGVKWKFGIGEMFPTLTPIQYQENRSNILFLEGLVDYDNKDSRAKNLMVSFETRDDRKAFEEHVRSWTREKKPEPVSAKKKKRGSIIAQISNAEVQQMLDVRHFLKKAKRAMATMGSAVTAENIGELVKQAKEEEIDDDDSAEDVGEDIAVFCEECEKAYDSGELNKRSQAGDDIVYICPKGHECASPN